MKKMPKFSIALKLRQDLLNNIDKEFDSSFFDTISMVSEAVQNNKMLIFAGNGGSAAEAQHMSAEYLATLDHRNFRPGIKSIALTVDTSFLTAWTNDFGFEEIFSRQIKTLGSEGDIFFAYSTSGTSKNIIEAIKVAKNKDIKIIGFTGNNGGLMKDICDICFTVPSNSTALIQEVHTIIGHEICSAVEKTTHFI
jgi:D-sedoheptulose 7-phosphate isomerase